MHRERVLKALAQLLVGVENKLHLADRRRRVRITDRAGKAA